MTKHPAGPAGARRLDGRLIALGVTGSIAAYKAVELVRLLTAEGADVSVLLSPAATRFVAPLTLAALSRHPVESELLELLPVDPEKIRVVPNAVGDEFTRDASTRLVGGTRTEAGSHLPDLQPDPPYGLRDARGVGVTEVVKDSPAEKAGLRAGDVITGVETLNSFRRLHENLERLIRAEHFRQGEAADR